LDAYGSGGKLTEWGAFMEHGHGCGAQPEEIEADMLKPGNHTKSRIGSLGKIAQQWPFLGLAMVFVHTQIGMAEENYKETRSRSTYTHIIPIYDANGTQIDPSDPEAPPYSPHETCKKCHDYEEISHGYHFNAAEAMEYGRRGEPWILVDPQTGTQLPISYRGYPGTFKPGDIGMSRFRFVAQFGRHMPGGGVGENPVLEPKPEVEAAEGDEGEAVEGEQPSANSEDGELVPVVDEDEAIWAVSGNLEIDCMICHGKDTAYSHEKWIKEIEKQNFAWAPTMALGLGKVEGEVKSLPSNFDPATAGENGPKLPHVTYDPKKFKLDGSVFFDVARSPDDNRCYACHTTRRVGENAPEFWTTEEDVHLKSGLTCADCHPNGLPHHTVRGYEGEEHPAGEAVNNLSCRGCHMDEAHSDTHHMSHDEFGGNFGAPKPLHKGLPTLHLDKLSCTACHSGPLPQEEAFDVQTAMAHSFGLASQTRSAEELPRIKEPVFMKNDEGVITPYRMMWPSYWGWMEGDNVSPMNPSDVYKVLRRALRIRKDFQEELSTIRLSKDQKIEAIGEEAASKPASELTEAEQDALAAFEREQVIITFREKMAEALQAIAETAEEGSEAAPVFIAAGKLYRLDEAGEKAEIVTDHAAAAPVYWPFAHDVRPARQALGVGNCYECHDAGSPLFHSTVTAAGPAPDDEPIQLTMNALFFPDTLRMRVWEIFFKFRSAFKYAAFAVTGFLSLILLMYLFNALNRLLNGSRRDQDLD
jgi:uncharacterized protein YnzC (UPF0291/DUF896 family)